MGGHGQLRSGGNDYGGMRTVFVSFFRCALISTYDEKGVLSKEKSTNGGKWINLTQTYGRIIP